LEPFGRSRDIEALHERPARVTKLLYDEDPPADSSGGLLSIFRRGGKAPAEPDTWEPTSSNELYVDKAWAGIHYLLTGTAWEGDPPLNFILGGTEIGNVDVGYGPARALTSDEIRNLAPALDALPPDALRDRFDPARMMELRVYPEIWDRDPEEDDTLGYLITNYTDLRNFVRRTADGGFGLIVYIA
jgi:Domain of unknown function (DUF1877)